MSCDHTKRHYAHVAVIHLADSGGFTTDIKIWCADCGVPFRFKGLPCGASPSEPMCSVVGEEARMPIEPLDLDGPLPKHWEDLMRKPD